MLCERVSQLSAQLRCSNLRWVVVDWGGTTAAALRRRLAASIVKLEGGMEGMIMQCPSGSPNRTIIRLYASRLQPEKIEKLKQSNGTVVGPQKSIHPPQQITQQRRHADLLESSPFVDELRCHQCPMLMNVLPVKHFRPVRVYLCPP